ncbi:hypothetical protein [Levilactobacillus brevis]|uniref:hypothetical protein n=1 Tax=Levilactobacillus brevis TaxID=1580 RepID=UPI002935CC28|nr:hypothetical protein [Levilactobacillus brevis]MDV2566171.1 hypothetical protein [Levilactobacillus brevis]MDV2584985.1 hypothetical protein [Levilactobacillus brevis]
MATPNVGILTTAGKALIDKVNSGQTKISFSKIVFSSMDNSQLSDMQVKALTAIAPQEVVVSSPETTLDTNSGETRIRATGTNEKLADGVYVKTYGVFAKDDTGSEILYGVTVSPNPNYFPAYDGVTPQAVTYSYKTVIQETSNITMTNSNDVYASQEDLTEALQPYAKTVDVNQQLDKKVNVTDMRKPASDVAGIEEVNAKQDAIGYTPADDSKVVHDNHDGTEQLNGVQVQPFNKLSDTIGGRNLLLGTSSVKVWNSTWNNNINVDVTHLVGTTLTYSAILDITDSKQGSVAVFLAPRDSSGKSIGDGIWSNSINWGNVGKAIATITIPAGASNLSIIEQTNNTTYNPQVGSRKLEQGSIATDWTPAPEDKADDSKVAHLSGANNFDTVPTVKNNPLLLASSLPSDLARTGSNQEFTGKNTFDTAPIDKTTGNPYITKSDVPKVDLSSYATQQQLATKADTSAIDPSVIVKTTLTATDDVLNLDYGSYTISGPLPKNVPDIENTGINWGTLVVRKILSGANKTLEYRDVKGNVLINILSGKPLTWSGWHVPNSGTMASKSDVTTAISAATANMVHRNPDTGVVSEPVDFTKLTVEGGKSVATRDDLKSLEASAWRVLTGSSDFLNPFTLLYRIHDDQKYMDAVIGGTVKDGNSVGGKTVVDLTQLVEKITSLSGSIVNDVVSNGNSELAFSGAKIVTPKNKGFTIGAICSTLGANNDTFFKISYSKLI